MKNKKLFYTCIIYYSILSLFVLVRVSTIIFDFSFLPSYIFDAISNIIVQVGLMFLFPILLFSKLNKKSVKSTFTTFRYNKISIKSFVICIGIGICCYFFNIAIASFFSNIIALLGYENGAGSSSVDTTLYSQTWYFIFNIFFVAVLPAICEETTHRGMLLEGFSSFGINRTIIFSSLFFGLMHLNINQFFYATILGFIMSLLVLVSNSIIPGMIIHFINNALGVYVEFASINNWWGGDFYQKINKLISGGNLFSVLVSTVFVLSVLMMFLVFLIWQLIKETRIKKMQMLIDEVARINKGEDVSTINTSDYMQSLATINAMLVKYSGQNMVENTALFSKYERTYNRPEMATRIVFIGCLILGGLVTISTFIWGMF